jgi:hypothetical protein
LRGAATVELDAFLVNLLASRDFRQEATTAERLIVHAVRESSIPNINRATSTEYVMGMHAFITLGLNSVFRIITEWIDRSKQTTGSVIENKSLVLPSDPVATSGLKILQNGNWQVANKNAGPQNNMAVGDVLYCAELGKMRFDTKLVRNLTWMVQLQRIMRVVLIDHLSWLNTPVVRGLKIIDPKITEYESNDAFDEKDFTGENYSLL